jgi:endonuclease/exonuclease/phosphatase family metal-dependent hydrolase
MWRIVAAVFAVALCAPAFADSIRVTTWNLQWFPSGSPNGKTPEAEAANIKAAAAVIVAINPDVLLLQEIRNWDTAQRLADALKSLEFRVSVCSAFRDPFAGGVGQQQVAILAKQDADAAWAESWKTKGVVDPPRGFAFAVIPFRKTKVAFYSVHLKSNLVISGGDRAAQLNILKRELSAEQLVAHAESVKKHFPTLTRFVVGGDFNTNRDQGLFISERTLELFEAAGFSDAMAGLPLARRITHPRRGRYPDATFDYILVKGAKAGAPPEILKSVVSDHMPVTLDLKIEP